MMIIEIHTEAELELHYSLTSNKYTLLNRSNFIPELLSDVRNGTDAIEGSRRPAHRLSAITCRM